MKRLITLFAVAGLFFAPLAGARDFSRGGWGPARYGGRGGYEARPRGFEQGPPAYPGYGGPRFAPVAPPPAYRGYPAYRGAGPTGWRRGERLAPALRGPIVANYAYYHLRRPPPGYYWRRSGDAFLLMAEGSGMIFEVISAEGY